MEAILTTERLVLRSATPEDVEALHAIASDFEVVRHTATWPWPPDRALSEERSRTWAGPGALGGLICHEGGILGMIGAHEDGFFGYMLGRDAWGRGFATEIGHAFVAHAFACGLPRLTACVFTDNPASARVLEKLGFVEGAPCEGRCEARNGVFPTRTFALEPPGRA